MYCFNCVVYASKTILMQYSVSCLVFFTYYIDLTNADGKYSAISQFLRELRRAKDGAVPNS